MKVNKSCTTCDNGLHSVDSKQVAGVDLVRHIAQGNRPPIGNDDVGLPLECNQVVDDPGVVKLGLLQLGLMNYHLNPFGLDALHHPLDGAGAVIIAASLHDEAVNAHHKFGTVLAALLRLLGLGLGSPDHLLGNKVFAGAVGAHYCLNQVLGHVLVVGQELLGVFRQAVAAVAKAGVVVVAANAGVKAHAVNDLPGI